MGKCRWVVRPCREQTFKKAGRVYLAIVPKQPLEMFGWYTVHIGASDVAVMGVKSQYMTYSLLLPPETSDQDFRTIVDSIHNTAVELGIAIVGGHTGYYPGFTSPTIGGITVFAIVDKDSLLPRGEHGRAMT